MILHAFVILEFSPALVHDSVMDSDAVHQLFQNTLDFLRVVRDGSTRNGLLLQ
jgi:hypothetical protein